MPLIAVENVLLLQKQFTQPPRTVILLGGEKWCSECGPDYKVDIYFNQVCLKYCDRTEHEIQSYEWVWSLESRFWEKWISLDYKIQRKIFLCM